MDRTELVRRVTNTMRENNIRKPVSLPKQVLHLSDDNGYKKDFIVRRRDKDVAFTAEDVKAVIETCMLVIEDAIRHGEEISVSGFGRLCVRYRKPKSVRNFETGEQALSEARYAPKFYCGNALKLAAKLYGLSLDDNRVNDPLPVFDDFDETGGEDDAD